MRKYFIYLSLIYSSCNVYHLESEWYRPAEEPVFAIDQENNHDAVLFVDTTLEYPYHLIISGWQCDPNTNEPQTFLWRTKSFSWSSEHWELISSNYKIGCHYEYDDGVKVGDTYYIYENGDVFTYTGKLEEGSGNWEKAGSFPKELADDVGVYYEDGTFHLFGEYGYFPHGPDGSSLSHLTSNNGLNNWILKDTVAVNPNSPGDHTFGVGDATIIKVKNTYYLFCDIESKNKPYRIIGWKTNNLYKPFKHLGVSIEPREGQTENWDNYRIQDGDIAFISELNKFVMVCNFRDDDGIPGGNFPRLSNFTRVAGFFYADFD